VKQSAIVGRGRMHWSRRAAPEVVDQLIDDLIERIPRPTPGKKNHHRQTKLRRRNLMHFHVLNLSGVWLIEPAEVFPVSNFSIGDIVT
jgi:hypothetical protein